jgi:hypothetical protein
MPIVIQPVHKKNIVSSNTTFMMKPFLTAYWKNLLMFNYEIEQSVLYPYIGFNPASGATSKHSD